jgi:hypothetical protein
LPEDLDDVAADVTAEDDPAGVIDVVVESLDRRGLVSARVDPLATGHRAALPPLGT